MLTFEMIKKRQQYIDNYLNSHTYRKLQLGSGNNNMIGWLNTDLNPSSMGIVHLDSTENFPIPSNAIDLVFSEHHIEHLGLDGSISCLREIFRILRPGGSLRIVTPDLEKIIQMYQNQSDPSSDRYISYISTHFLMNKKGLLRTNVINNLFYGWEHRYIFDSASMEKLLSEAGFINIIRQLVDQSDKLGFKDVEQHGKTIVDNDINEMESMVFEADKPSTEN